MTFTKANSVRKHQRNNRWFGTGLSQEQGIS